MNKIYLTLILSIFLISLSSGITYNQCYQETATSSTTCGGLNTGSYDFTSNWQSGTNYAIDGIWDNNYALAQNSGISNLTVNYSKPINTVAPLIWQIKANPNDETNITNITIPSTCINFSSDKVSLRIAASRAAVNSKVYCLNSSGYAFIYDGGVDFENVLYEEAIIWNISTFREYNIIYNNNTYETSTENFTLNFSVSNAVSASANFIYNNTIYISEVNCSSTLCSAYNTLNMPQTSLEVNKTFYWTISLYNGTGIEQINSTFKNQTVKPITLTYCTSGSRVLNFTAYDEQNKTRLYNFTFDATFEYSTGGTNTKVINISNSSATEINLCINVNTTYYLNAIIAYSKTGYPLRNWFFQNYPITNVTQNISLYLLQSSASTSFILQVQDTNAQAVPNFLVNAQRCYVGTNSNETVFIHRTDSSGLTTGNFEAETALYKFFITNNSQTVLTVDQCSKVVPQTSPYTLLFQLGEDYQSPFNNIDDVTQITSNIVYNTSNNVVTWTYIDTSGKFVSANMSLVYLNASGNTEQTVCTSSSTLSSSIITCNTTQGGSYAVNILVKRTDENIWDRTIITVQTVSNTLGYYGVFLGFFITLIACFLFKFNEIAGIWGIVIVCWFNNFVGLINYGIPSLTAITAIAIIITGVLER